MYMGLLSLSLPTWIRLYKVMLLHSSLIHTLEVCFDYGFDLIILKDLRFERWNLLNNWHGIHALLNLFIS